MLATLVSLHYNRYKNRVKLANFKISYNLQKCGKLVLINTFCV